jgi:hypothetical protein
MPLDVLTPGSVRDVSAVIATWLVAQGYAEFEMRRIEDETFSGPEPTPHRRREP